MIRVVANGMTWFVSRYLPSPLLFAIILGFVILIWGICIGTSPIDMVRHWGDGFWNLLAFTMQMAMVVITGCALASSTPIKKLLKKCASIAKTPRQAVALVTFSATLACIINWGFGLVVGALFAKEVARRMKNIDYALLIACAYMGFMVWGAGFSGSMPLLAATPGNPMEKLVGGVIPIADTLFTGYNFFVVIALLIVLPILAVFMVPKTPKTVDPSLLAEEPSVDVVLGEDSVPAEKLEESRIIALIVVTIGVIYLIDYFMAKGFNITINTVNLIFVLAGLLFHKTPMAYMRAVSNATRSSAGVLMQFPFYASIAVMMEKSGVGSVIANFFVHISTIDSFYVTTWIASSLINFAVPSGGGHWVVQGPFVIESAKIIGADLGKATMAIAYGDMWSNMAQPFWALPALAIAGLGVRDIMGYCMTAMLFTTPIFAIALYFF